MRRLSLPFPLLVTAGANAFNLTLLLAFGDPFGRGLADQGTTRDRPARWSATLAPPSTGSGAVPGDVRSAGPMQGRAAMRLGPDGRSTHVTVDLASAAPGSVHPWQLRHGRCGQDGGAVGGTAAYEALTVDARGRAAGGVTVPLLTPAEGPYFVRVAASAADPETIVACGNLAAATR